MNDFVKISKNNPEYYELGKIPPQAINIEEAVLGALMLEKDAYDDISNLLTANVFHKNEHRIVFEAIVKMKTDNNPVDVLTIADFLRKKGVLEEIGGAYYISQLTNKVGSSANIDYHSRIIYEKYILRELIRLSSKTLNKAYSDTDEDIFTFVEDVINKLEKLITFDNFESKNLKELSEILLDTIELNRKNENTITGMPSGFKLYDKFSKGCQKSDLMIIAGESSMGKSSLALNICDHVSDFAPVLVISLEMSLLQLSARLFSSNSGVSSKSILFDSLTDLQLVKITDNLFKMKQKNIFIDDVKSNNINQIIANIKYNVKKHDIKLVVVDYMQLCSDSNTRTREQEVGAIARKLKNLAKNLDICIIAVSQLNRDKQNPKPTLSRLRDSGQIEEAADVVIFVYRPEYYNKEFLDPAFQDNLHNIDLGNVFSKNMAQIIVAKGRNIGITEFVLEFEKYITTFKDYNPEEVVNTKELF